MDISKEKIGKIIREAINSLLKEQKKLAFDIDITKIPIDDLRRGYVDYRLIPYQTRYGDILQSPTPMMETVGDVYPPDEALEKIMKKYEIPSSFGSIKEGFNKIYVYLVVAIIGENDKKIEEDMKKLGYFLGVKGDKTVIEGMIFQVLQFEPMTQIQKDDTLEIKEKYGVLYHWTPEYNIDEILEHGLIPKSENQKFNYPPRIYLIKGDAKRNELLSLGSQLSMMNQNENNNGVYGLLSVDISNLDDNIKLYYGPNSDIGIFCENPIQKENIKLITKANFIGQLNI